MNERSSHGEPGPERVNERNSFHAIARNQEVTVMCDDIRKSRDRSIRTRNYRTIECNLFPHAAGHHLSGFMDAHAEISMFLMPSFQGRFPWLPSGARMQHPADGPTDGGIHTVYGRFPKWERPFRHVPFQSAPTKQSRNIIAACQMYKRPVPAWLKNTL